MFLIFGVVRPAGLSIAIEKLWSCFRTYSCMYPSSSTSGFTIELSSGNFVSANESAFMKNGSTVRSGTYCLSSRRSSKRPVQSISSEKPNAGIDRDSVIVFVIAFCIPLIFLTWSFSVIPLNASWTGTIWEEVAVLDTYYCTYDYSWFPSDMKLSTSPLVTLPFFPVPTIALMSKLCFFARCLTAGVERALVWELP